MPRSHPQRIEPQAGQESVWDYPRPPKLERVAKRLRVVVAGEIIADTASGYRVLETSHPPTYYFPPADVRMALLSRSKRRSLCEWKGQAVYYDLAPADRVIRDVAWSYPAPVPAFAPLRDCLCFYPSKVDACYVGDEPAQAQAGDFYGGWITRDIVGPFKGAPGTMGW